MNPIPTMSSHNPISSYDRFILADAVVEANHSGNATALEEAISNFREVLGGDASNWDDARVVMVSSNIVALG